ncbi:penicillin-binding protein 1A [Parabacteroides sp. PF5-5]|uniref:transglycosylase domain-containing protein n=1 Tax=unclassified Parabacteroides TaxID=2649774 RepID=UPI002473F83A|nr:MULTISPECIES: transglycosylase domain-containing protein [unclassified Parabacteroides]MDH6304291.1 penicillin-binding protein 1A [Parabacteroides sp. PH5-39]MDH6314994.1 penicillin-binding protein 1A [Parabacteroides sp. PF5-13]MDH6318654.1 penicillin-binding protein 1A [Parabacteroides sp. PH5-13]MDH6322384.1 penicillin-binding protein 1A [Parabacteroides sp. PH5-8]MDH6326481.1 penicillin-binding protein 1A [Parabacteroides sp. PH5-41]
MTSKVKKNIILGFWILYAVIMLTVVVLFVAISKGSIGYMPPVEQLENPIDKYASLIISADGKTLNRYAHSSDNRIQVNYNDLSPELVKALIATEDIRFSKHSGIDVQGLFRAIIKRGLLFQKNAGGGSTITQQLAKQLYSPNVNNMLERLLQKPIEWVIAVKLERYYTKEEIINLYLNKFDFLYNAVGIQSAAQVYFNTTPRGLKVEEAATLIGMCKNPSLYNPVRFNDRTRQRRNVVLSQMEKADYLTKAQCDSLSALPLTLHFSRLDHKEGLAPYFREYLRMTMTAKKPEWKNYGAWQRQKFQEDSTAWEVNPLYGWCNKNKKADGSFYNIYTDGLKIYTTIDARMQQYAEDAVREHIGQNLQPAFFKEKKGRSYAPFSRILKTEEVDTILFRSMQQTDRYRGMKKGGMSEANIRKEFQKPVEMTVFSWNGQVDTIMSPMDSIRYHKSFLRSAFMAMDPRTGHVKAYVGGIDFNNFQYDMVNGGRRQIGSTMKPFLYSLAMLEGFSPCDQVLHVQQHLTDENGTPWSPKNAGAKRVGEMVTINWGLQNSSNWVTAYLMKQLSPYTLVRLLHSFGLKGNIDPVVSLALGTPDISVGEMVGAYSVFANKGIRVEPMYVTRIEDSYGNTIATFNPHMQDVLTEEATYKTLHMLRSVMDGGTGSRIRYRYNIRVPMGGKTGTTQNHSDGWFMAFTPSLVGGCWVGGEDRSIHFDTMNEGQGASMALPIYGIFMQKVYADKTLGYSETENFDVPSQYANPCKGYSEEDIRNIPTDVGGIDKMFQ